MAEDPQSLRGAWLQAEKKRRVVESTSESLSAQARENLESAILAYENCLQIVSRLSLFSPNESLEDISSGGLTYLTLHFRVAELLFKTSGDRKDVLGRARKQFEAFLQLLDSYEALSVPETKLYETYREDRDGFSTASTLNAAARRQTKISRFKEEKELKAKLERLRQDPAALQNEDAVLRDLHLTNITLCVHQTFAYLESIAQEVQVLTLAPPPTETHRPVSDSRERGQQSDGYSERLDLPLSSMLANGRAGPILDKNGKPLRPFTILDSRQRMREGVFRPDHSLPTMTIDEYLEEEKKRGGIIDGGGPQSQVREQVDEDDMNVADQETMKARDWDVYKEANPKGAGNTLNRG